MKEATLWCSLGLDFSQLGGSVVSVCVVVCFACVALQELATCPGSCWPSPSRLQEGLALENG